LQPEAELIGSKHNRNVGKMIGEYDKNISRNTTIQNIRRTLKVSTFTIMSVLQILLLLVEGCFQSLHWRSGVTRGGGAGPGERQNFLRLNFTKGRELEKRSVGRRRGWGGS